MLEEKDLLHDLIEYCPQGSVWLMTKDSWERLPELLQAFLLSDPDPIHIKVGIDNNSRNNLLRLVTEYDLPDKIVHQEIVDSLGNSIARSWDRMMLTEISRTFPEAEKLIAKYGATDYFIVGA